MAKKVAGFIKLQLPAGKANPSPPVGPALGQHGVNIMQFCKAYNAKTQSQEGSIIPVIITDEGDQSRRAARGEVDAAVYEDLFNLFRCVGHPAARSFLSFAKRYCDAYRNDYGWVDYQCLRRPR